MGEGVTSTYWLGDAGVGIAIVDTGNFDFLFGNSGGGSRTGRGEPTAPVSPCRVGGGRRFKQGHRATDIQTPSGLGTRIPAPESGRVTAAYGTGWRIPPPYNLSRPAPVGATNYVQFRTDSGYTVTYWHVTALLPQPQQVPKGATIGFSDDSGRQTSWHVHVTVRDPSSTAIDPLNYLTDCK